MHLRALTCVAALAALASCGAPGFSCHYNGGSGSGGACSLKFACGTTSFDQMREIDCSPKTGGFSCTCINASVVEKSFTSTDACQKLTDTGATEATAHVGCGWPTTTAM